MRFLKNKIFKAQEALKRKNNKLAAFNYKHEANNGLKLEIEPITFQTDKHSSKREQGNSSPQSYSPSKESLTTIVGLPLLQADTSLKNIAVNYGKTIATFAASPIAFPYLDPFITSQKHITLSEFHEFARQQKAKIAGVSSLRSALLASEDDNEKAATCKRIFQELAEVFVKYFSVNWIMSGRLSHKMAYLKFRGKMLRRIRNPESFTYIKEREPIQKKRRNI